MSILTALLRVIIYAVLLAIQYFLSKTGNKILEAVVSIFFIITLTHLFLTEKLGLNILGTIILGVIRLLFLLGQWHSAQKKQDKIGK
ncbi:hypothetical protein [Staphylococcus edaphicus]|uniref:Uncharacterized protein n=1 Tax=Staphylococcus edaphicus TaxID=1955013 RepID=A0A2C6U670_9STAP|nr:hypothetical protein BTJ66_08475 [Staphylococcus edaphicus]